MLVHWVTSSLRSPFTSSWLVFHSMSFPHHVLPSVVKKKNRVVSFLPLVMSGAGTPAQVSNPQVYFLSFLITMSALAWLFRDGLLYLFYLFYLFIQFQFSTSRSITLQFESSPWAIQSQPTDLIWPCPPSYRSSVSMNWSPKNTVSWLTTICFETGLKNFQPFIPDGYPTKSTL